MSKPVISPMKNKQYEVEQSRYEHVSKLPTRSVINAGTKVIKFQLNSDGWCDPSTVRVMFNLENNDTAAKM